MWNMVNMEIFVRQSYSSGNSGKILIYAHNSGNNTWSAFNASLYGSLTSSVVVYGYGGKYFYIGGCSAWGTISIDKILIGDAATNYDVSGITIDYVSSMPSGYQTATCYREVNSGNIGSQSVMYATNSTYLYASDTPYRYGDSAPYYMKMRYNTNGDNRWYLSVYPETPKSVAVDYAYSAGSATYASKVYDSNYTSQPITFSYYTGGFSSNPTWLAAWSGYHITYVSPSVVTVGLSSKVTCTEGSGATTRPIVVTNQSNQLYYASKCYIHYDNGYIYAAAFFESSDERLKDFENDIDTDFNTIKAIPKKYFRWKDRPNDLQIGTSAQVIQRFYPEIVTSSTSGFLNVDYSKLSIVALSAIDKLHDTDNELKLEIIRLKERITHLENLLNNK
jgi:hypothetical protein